MAESNLLGGVRVIDDGMESIVVVNAVGDIPGGVTLDVAAEKAAGTAAIKCGHVLIKTKAGAVKPLGVTKGAYAVPAEGETYLGILKATVAVGDPRAAVVTIGQINAKACPFPITAAIAQGLPRIEFLNL